MTMTPLVDYAGFEDAKSEVYSIFARRVGDGHTPGCFFAVFDQTGLVFDGGFGGRALGSPTPDAQTRFRIASCTKSFTVAALLVLRDAGRISLDDPINLYVPELRGALPAAAPIVPSLRMLMSMAGGLPTDDPWADRQEALSGAAFLKVLTDGVRFTTVPGSRFEYSNLGYALLGQVVERVSGQPFPEFVTDALLRPLGLGMTTFDHQTVPAEHKAIGYRPRLGAWLDLPFSGPGAFSSIGGLISTGADLSRWAAWLCAAFDEGAAEEGPLSAASRREMQRIHCPIIPEPEEALTLKGYGFGLIAQTDARHGVNVHHSGGYPGFSSHMRWNPARGIGVVGFENATYSGAWMPVAAALERLLDLDTSRAADAPPAEVAELGAKIAGLVARWDDGAAASICLENVTLDCPFEERAAELRWLLQKVGTPDPARMEIRPMDGGDFGRFELRVPCTTGVISAQAVLGPPQPARLQTLTFGIAT
ncbi:beta-lactamase family protein [Thioclava sp. BHET1]|nr:beta-lactamase family protein [Thioclava sp. BHET1]